MATSASVTTSVGRMVQSQLGRATFRHFFYHETHEWHEKRGRNRSYWYPTGKPNPGRVPFSLFV